jgi:tetratricopeptide (TPR) repeat protein
MKKTVLLSVILTSFIIAAFAGNYEKTMQTNIEKMNQCTNAEEMVSLANAFERVAQKETEKWLPYYYAAYANTSVLFFDQKMEADKKKEYLQNAQNNLDEAIALEPGESENYALQALIYQISIINPSDGQKYMGKVNEALAKAEALNENNPRVYYMKGTMLFHTPEQFGGGKKAAKPMFKKAAGLFENTSNNGLMPSWGMQHNSMLLEQCNK